MWKLIARYILTNRVKVLVALLVITLFFGYLSTKIELSYKFARVLPNDDQSQIDYDAFKKLYGEDGNVMVIGCWIFPKPFIHHHLIGIRITVICY